MANTYKNIVITPNRDTDAANVPFIRFSGGDATSNTDINVRVYTAQSGTLSFEGSAGQLFSITNDLTNTIFSVNDVSGIPSLEIDAAGLIKLAEFGGNVAIGRSNASHKLDIVGTANASNILVNGNMVFTPANDGAGSNLDADFLDGQHGSYYGIATDVTAANRVANAAFLNANAGYAFANSAHAIANLAFTHANNAFANANTVMVSAQAAFTVANSGFIHANSAFATVNSAFATINVAFANANTVMISTQAAFTVANAAFLHANAVFAAANADYAFSNSAHAIANLAFTHANGAFAKANAALANTAGISTAGGLVVPGILVANTGGGTLQIRAGGTSDHTYIEYYPRSNTGSRGAYVGYGGAASNNFSIINETTTGSLELGTAGGADLAIDSAGNVGVGRTNPGFKLDVVGTANASNILVNGNMVFTPANDGAGSNLDADFLDGQHGSYYGIATDVTGAFASANAGQATANVALARSNTLFITANSAWDKANTANITADRAWNHANAAFNSANIALSYRGTITETTIGDNTSNAIRTTGVYTVSYTGASDGLIDIGGIGGSSPRIQMRFNYADELYFRVARDSEVNFDTSGPFSNRIWHSSNDGAGSTLDADFLDGQHGSYYGISTDVTAANRVANAAFLHANAAFANANSVMISAQSAFTVANSGFIHANSAFATVNSAFATVNVAFANANTVMISAQAAFTVANSGFLHANSGYAFANSIAITANLAFAHANADYAFSNSAHSIANLAFVHANAAFAKANTGGSSGRSIIISMVFGR